MRTKILSLLFLLALPLTSFAQNAKLDLVGTPMLISLSGSTLTVGTVGTQDFRLVSGDTARIVIDGAQGEVIEVVQSCTAAATPVAGTNDLKGRVVAIPTVAANAACILPTPEAAGIQKLIMNTGANTVRVKPGSTNTINGGTAGAWLPLATLSSMPCVSTSTTNWNCDVAWAVPTPQGP